MTSTTAKNTTPDAMEEDFPSYPISSVDNALKLLILFSRQRTVRVVDASRELGVARSTAHRLVQMLQHFQLVVQDPETKSYAAGPELIRMSLSVVRQLDLRTVARPIMEAFVDDIEETVNLAKLSGNSVVFLDSIETQRSLRIGGRAGRSLPAHSSASGKVLLADLDHDALLALYPNEELSTLTSNTISSRSVLFEELELVRKNGYATNFGESEAEVHSVAVPIRDYKGRARGALAVSVPTSRLNKSQVKRFADALSASAAEIGEGLPL